MHEATLLANTSLLQMQLTSVLQMGKERKKYLSSPFRAHRKSKRIELTMSNLRFALMKLYTQERNEEGKVKVRVRVRTGTTLLTQTERQSLN